MLEMSAPVATTISDVNELKRQTLHAHFVSDLALTDHCARLQIIFTYILYIKNMQLANGACVRVGRLEVDISNMRCKDNATYYMLDKF